MDHRPFNAKMGGPRGCNSGSKLRSSMRRRIDHNKSNRLKRAADSNRGAIFSAVLRTTTTATVKTGTTRRMDPGDEFIGTGATSNGRHREAQQRVLPVYELLFRAGDASSASLRVATALPGEPQTMRCAIPSDSRRAFIPGTLALHRDGRKVGREEDGGNSISYDFVPWEETIVPTHQGGSIIKQDGTIIRRRHTKRKRHRKAPKPILFHCSATVFPREAQKRGRLAATNVHQRTLKILPWQGKQPAVTECPEESPHLPPFCKNGGKCAQSEPDGTRYCLCPPNFTGRYCERISTGLIGSIPLSALCLSGTVLLLLLIVLVLLALLSRERRIHRKRTKTMMAVAVRLHDKEEDSADTPLEDLYDTADAMIAASSSPPKLCSPSPSPSRIPRLYSAPQKKPKAVEEQNGGSDSSGSNSNGYDNLERLREEIRRQKPDLEERRAVSRLEMALGEGFELRRTPDMDDLLAGGSLPSSQAPSPPKRSGYVNLGAAVNGESTTIA